LGAGLLNVAGYYDPLVAMLKRAHEEGFIADNWTDLVLVADVPWPLSPAASLLSLTSKLAVAGGG
jgi:predicted Rossmann-fold nucleotide-binding protein